MTLRQQAEANSVGSRRDAPGTSKSRGEMGLLLRYFVTLLAIQYRRAPLPVSPSFMRVCLRLGFPGGVGDLESLARRYLFWGDEGLARRELQTQADAVWTSGPALPMANRIA
jgi:DNA-binding NtrC family response regulator